MKVIDGQDFATAFRKSENPLAPTKPTDPRLEILGTFFADGQDGDADVETARALMLVRIKSNEECDAFIAKLRRANVTALEEAHESIKREARAQQERIEKINEEIAYFRAESNKLNDAYGKAISKYHDAKNAEQGISRFATKAEIRAATVRREKAEALASKCEAACTDAQLRINDLVLVELPRAIEKLNQIAAEELRLRSAITGEGFTDPEFGIQFPPRPPAAA
jgi:hypothetical protein